MPVLMLDISDYATHTPSLTTHLRREGGQALCGDRWGVNVVVEAGEMPEFLPFEVPCELCVAAHEAEQGG